MVLSSIFSLYPLIVFIMFDHPDHPDHDSPQSAEKDSMVDVLGICKSVGDVVTINTKYGFLESSLIGCCYCPYCWSIV